MDDYEEEKFNFFGKPLEQYDEDEIPKKKPIFVEDQIATDSNGRRRFHGAFTGGFSAGFFNTVGSAGGWQPTEFKSSRSEKSVSTIRTAEDYMDEEDIGEFGIAPQVIKATKDFNTSKKRKKKVFSDGPIPGVPVLHMLIDNSTETIGYLLLRNIGFKHEGTEISKQQRVYGSTSAKAYEMRPSIRNSTYKLPEIYEEALKIHKNNTFGIGYKGLDRGYASLKLSQKNFVVKNVKNKNMTIGGQAFGVGAFEDEDDDIYGREDIESYDFEMHTEKQQEQIRVTGRVLFDSFILSSNYLAVNEIFPVPTIPRSFSGKHKVRKSRFAPIQDESSKEEPKKTRRCDIDATTRAEALGEKAPENSGTSSKSEDIKPEIKEKKEDVAPWLVFDKFVSAGQSDEHTDPMVPAEKSSSVYGTEHQREAAKLKMFGDFTRTTEDWLPHTFLCKRFNVPEPAHWENVELKTPVRKRNLIFQNEKEVDETGRVQSSGLQNNPDFKVPHENQSLKTIDSKEQSTKNDESKEGDIGDSTPLMEVEIPTIDITEKIDVSKNKDLFKAIFFSDDEDEDTVETKVESESRVSEQEKLPSPPPTSDSKMEEMKEAILAKDIFLPKIKPLKQGILSDIPFIKFTKPGTVPTQPEPEVIEEVPQQQPDDNLYGPKLPEKIVNRVENLMESKSDDVWVERKEEKTKKEKHKKHKKEKHKKKHKHKR
ncbi:PREDICTED: G patch domain-containing protein 1 [Nicrophorus vespilloides]|uniref:G patch domain-containing protein 1 n=1 Tax=Nicrophorus vespilloides TaxID=110193 RepID=A0ABM1MNM2_NICVS|nr:PREDICTED: G patch domain-containing protein 1 [Nicrophorus vespilloides]